MCGITGFWAPNRQQFGELQQNLQNAVSALYHRGPDFQNSWINNKDVGLGHARLSIVDLSANSNQPLCSEDNNLHIVFNGEIYNYQEIRHDLKKKGYVFKSDGDAEVVLYAFREWGSECVHRFIGMFAFAIWDESNRRLYLCVDRVGVKPLYYAADKNSIVFGSELKAVREYSNWTASINKAALSEYFKYGYICAPNSIYNGVHKLEPGHWLEVKEDLQVSPRCYWSIYDNYPQATNIYREDELLEELESLLVDAFKYRMVADVPVGVFLSGGIDSSLVASILQKHTKSDIQTFTIGFGDSEFDESKWAKRVAEYLGTNHTEKLLKTEEAKRILLDWHNLYDEPFGDSSRIPTYLVSKIARSEVKVSLSADGGDELFGGYTNYEMLPKRLNTLTSIPYIIRHIANIPLKRLSRNTLSKLLYYCGSGYFNKSTSKIVDRLLKLAGSLPNMESSKFFELAISYWMDNEIEQLIGNNESVRIGLDNYVGRFEEKMMLWDFQHYLPGDILTKVDRATMSVSLEGREPMLDHRLAEFAFKLPYEMRRGELGGKHILKKILYKYLPRELVDRPKQGFSIPLRNWLKTDLSYLLDQYLGNERIKNSSPLDARVVRQTLNEFRKGSGNDVNRIWLILAFEMWKEKWV